MFCHEPNTRHQKIGSRFRAETVHGSSRFGVALADLGGVLVGDNTPGDFLGINQSRVPWVRGACCLALCDLLRAGVRCRSPTLRSLSYPGELWIFAERCDSSTHQSVLGHISGCRLQNCCSSHGSHNISGCRFQNCRSSPGSQNISGCRLQNCRITQLLLYWELSRQGWPRPAGYSSIEVFSCFLAPLGAPEKK